MMFVIISQPFCLAITSRSTDGVDEYLRKDIPRHSMYGIYTYTWNLDCVTICTYNSNKFLSSQTGRIFVFYDFIRSGLLGRIEVISRKFPNLGIRSGYVLFAFNLRSFGIQLHSGVNQT